MKKIFYLLLISLFLIIPIETKAYSFAGRYTCFNGNTVLGTNTFEISADGSITVQCPSSNWTNVNFEITPYNMGAGAFNGDRTVFVMGPNYTFTNGFNIPLGPSDFCLITQPRVICPATMADGSFQFALFGSPGRSSRFTLAHFDFGTTIDTDTLASYQSQKNQSDSSTNSINSSITGMGSAINDSINSSTNSINGSINSSTNSINGNINSATDNINGNINSATDSINSNINDMGSNISSSIGDMSDSINSSIGDMSDSINGSINSSTDSINSSIGNMTDSINSNINDAFYDEETCTETVSPNLFPQNVELKKCDPNTGSCSSNASWYLSDFMEYDTSSRYSLMYAPVQAFTTGNNNLIALLYDSNRNFIGGYSVGIMSDYNKDYYNYEGNWSTPTTGSRLKYIRFNINTNGYTLSDIMFAKGYNFDYVPYGTKTECTGGGNKLDSVNDNLNNVNDSINDLNSNITNSDINDANSSANEFFSGFESEDFGLSSIITAPLNLIKSITSSTCTPIGFTAPFVNQQVTLPCMSSIYSQFFGSFLTIYQTITFGMIAYWISVNMFAMVKGFKDPNSDRIEVLDL